MRLALSVLLLSGIALSGGVAEARVIACPEQMRHQALASTAVYDGPVEEMASLAPDIDAKGRPYLDLGTVYDQGRKVYLECRYQGGGRKVIEVKRRVGRCMVNAVRLECE